MKRNTTIILFAISVLLLIVIACTLPIYIVTSPEATVEKEVVVVTAEPTMIPPEPVAPTVAVAPTYAVTPTVSVNLDGPWTIWEGRDQKRLDIDFLQKGFEVTGNAATEDGQSILYKGSISYDGTSVSGTWESTSGTTGSFVMYLESSYSMFSGNMGGGVPFCGNRLNTSMPSPCLK